MIFFCLDLGHQFPFCKQLYTRFWTIKRDRLKKWYVPTVSDYPLALNLKGQQK